MVVGLFGVVVGLSFVVEIEHLLRNMDRIPVIAAQATLGPLLAGLSFLAWCMAECLDGLDCPKVLHLPSTLMFHLRRAARVAMCCPCLRPLFANAGSNAGRRTAR